MLNRKAELGKPKALGAAATGRPQEQDIPLKVRYGILVQHIIFWCSEELWNRSSGAFLRDVFDQEN